MSVAISVFALALDAEAASCRGYPESVRSVIKSRIEALRMIEREAADRLVGLDTRPFDWLVAQARAAARVIAEPNALVVEEALNRCRNHVPPVRRICAAAASTLAAVLEELAKGAATKDSKQAYAEAMPKCERWMGLNPLSTALRASD